MTDLCSQFGSTYKVGKNVVYLSIDGILPHYDTKWSWWGL